MHGSRGRGLRQGPGLGSGVSRVNHGEGKESCKLWMQLTWHVLWVEAKGRAPCQRGWSGGNINL